MSDPALAFESITGLAAKIRTGTLSPVALTEALLDRIATLDGRLHAFIALTRERALAEARAAELARRGGQDLGPLHGIPYAAKDLIDVRGVPTTAGTRLLAGNVAKEDAAVVRRLASAGMVLLGKTYTVQFAFGGVGANHDQGTPHNPWHATHHVPGGSSSGSAVAVAGGLTPMALGSDTGGSVRLPAALCGTVGLKTTVGRVSRAGVYPLSFTLDSIGPLTRTVEDAALVYQALQGEDSRDETTEGVRPHDAVVRLKDGVRGLRVAFAETLFFDEVDPEVERAVRDTAGVFRSLGAHVESIETPEVAEAMSEQKRAFAIAAEACVYNARFLDQHFDELDPVVAHRMIGGRQLSAPDYFGLHRQWAELRRRLRSRLADVDALLVPTTPLASRPLAEVDQTRESYSQYNARYLRNTAVGNNLNLCGVSLPCGFTQEGLPIGLMVYGKPFQEDVVLRVAYAYERATDWHRRRPDLAWAAGEARPLTGPDA
jgi:aspartyl-tRNA(Asn)/glutamyl-tRNA(Gln) amidotransferase subunit A